MTNFPSILSFLSEYFIEKALRNAALNLIVILYKFAGKIRPFYTNLRPAKINNIEDNIAQYDELNENIMTIMNNIIIYNIEPGDYVYDNDNNNNINNDEIVNNSQMLSKDQQNEYNMNNDDDT